MTDRNLRLLAVFCLTALTPLTAHGQPVTGQPVQVQSIPDTAPGAVGIGTPQPVPPPYPPNPAPPPAPPVAAPGTSPPAPPAAGPGSTFQPLPVPSGPPATQPPLPPVGDTFPPPVPGPGVGPPPVIPQAPLFVTGQPPGNQRPGMFDGCPFIALELGAVDPIATDHLQAVIPRNNGTFLGLTPPSHSLDWTWSPILEFGWRLPENGGELAVDYRFIASEGTGPIATGGGTFAVRSRLDINQFDFGYTSVPEEFAPHWDIRWRLGARVAVVFYDTQATSALVQDTASNNFVGTGPEGGLEVQWHLPVLPAFSLYARADGSVMVGQITQKYSEVVSGNPLNPLSAGADFEVTQSVPTLSASVGMSYTPPAMNYLHFSAGYEWEHWWSLGRADNARLDLTTNTFFLRGQFDF